MTNPFEFIDARLSNIENLLIDLALNPKLNLDETQPSNTWFNLTELCAYLPDKPAKATVYSWVHNNTIPFHKGSKRLRFLKSEIDLFLKKTKKNTNAEIAAAADAYINSKNK